MKASQSCFDCVFFRSFGDEDEGDGECRRYPPVFDSVTARDAYECGESTETTEVRQAPWVWCRPVVNQDDWCGEFKRRRAA